MKYEPKAENNVEKKTLNEMGLTGVNVGSSGRLAVNKSDKYLNQNKYNAKQGASILAKNLLSILANDPAVANDPKAAAFKMKKIAYLLYSATKTPEMLQQLAVAPPEEQDVQPKIPGTF